MTDSKYKAMVAAFIAGALLITAGLTGESIWILFNSIVALFVNSALFQTLFLVLITIASFGGFSVIAGGILIALSLRRLGKFIIMLGTGMGIIGLALALVFWLLGGIPPLSANFIIGVLGVGFSLYARVLGGKENKE